MNNYTHEDYIYLDWNAFVNLTQFKCSYIPKALMVIKKYRKKGFAFPYSEGHIRDIFSKSDFEMGQYTAYDFELIRKITNRKYIAHDNFDDKLSPICDCDPKVVFDDLRRQTIQERMAAKIIQDREIYKLLRDAMLDDELLVSFVLSKYNYGQIAYDFISVIRTENKNVLKRKFQDALRVFYNISYPGNYSWEYLLTIGFRLLDITKLFKEKVDKNNTPFNIMNDGLHVYCSQNAKYIITDDIRFTHKYRFFKEMLNLKPEIMSLEQFAYSLDGGSNSQIIAL